jgi:hypothetical protein
VSSEVVPRELAIASIQARRAMDAERHATPLPSSYPERSSPARRRFFVRLLLAVRRAEWKLTPPRPRYLARLQGHHRTLRLHGRIVEDPKTELAGHRFRVWALDLATLADHEFRSD